MEGGSSTGYLKYDIPIGGKKGFALTGEKTYEPDLKLNIR
jgi:hypothetical protein